MQYLEFDTDLLIHVVMAECFLHAHRFSSKHLPASKMSAWLRCISHLCVTVTKTPGRDSKGREDIIRLTVSGFLSLTVGKAKAVYITVGQEAEGGGTRDQGYHLDSMS